MQIFPFNMILQHYKDVQRINIFAENSNLCFYYQTKCIVLSFSQYVVMNAFLLIAGQKAHICGVNHIFVLQETSRNESKSCCKLEWSPACMRRDISALFAGRWAGDVVFHSLCYTVAPLCCCTSKDEFTHTEAQNPDKIRAKHRNKQHLHAIFECMEIWSPQTGLAASDLLIKVWFPSDSLLFWRGKPHRLHVIILATVGLH